MGPFILLLTACTIASHVYGSSIADSEFEGQLYRRWLSEEDADADSEHEANFALSQIAEPMEEIMTAYDDAIAIAASNNSESEHARRRLGEADNATWDCSTTEEMHPLYSEIAEELELFVDANCEHAEHEAHEHTNPDGVYLVLYCAFVLFIGCGLKWVQHRFHLPLPYTVLLLIAGVLIEVIELSDEHLASGLTQVRYVAFSQNVTKLTTKKSFFH